jgi:hypothetical protein
MWVNTLIREYPQRNTKVGVRDGRIHGLLLERRDGESNGIAHWIERPRAYTHEPNRTSAFAVPLPDSCYALSVR